MASIISLCNRSLSAIGTRSSISSLTEGSQEAIQCSLLYSPVVTALLRAAHWDFARAQISLAQLKSANDANSTCPVPWAYEYAYPSDCLKMRFIQPFYSAGDQGIPFTTAPTIPVPFPANNRLIKFLVATDKDAQNNDSTVILTNEAQAMGVYTRNITNPILFDSQFQEAVVAGLGAHLVPALALNLSLMKMQIEIADKMIAQARITNGNEGPMTQDSLPDWMQIRGGRFRYPGVYFNSWDNMCWPGGF